MKLAAVLMFATVMLGLSATPFAQYEYFIPHIADGNEGPGGPGSGPYYETRIYAGFLSFAADNFDIVNFELELFRGDGTPMLRLGDSSTEGTTSRRSIPVQGRHLNATLTLPTVSGTNRGIQPTLETGWAIVRSPIPMDVFGVISYRDGTKDNRALLKSSTLVAVPPATTFSSVAFLESTAMALVNTSTTGTALIGFGFSGLPTQGCSGGTISLAPRQKFAGFLRDFREPGLGFCPEKVQISSSTPLSAAFINVVADGWITYPLWRLPPTSP